MRNERKDALGLAGIAALVVLSLGVLVWQSSQPPEQEQQQYPATDAAKHVGAPSAAEERIADYTLAVAWLTGVLAFSTIGLWGATILTLRHARETAERQLRAYVLKHTAEIRFQGADKVVVAFVTFKNFGQTPGYDLNAWTHCKIADANKPPFDDVTGNNQRSVIGPGGEYHTCSDPIPMSVGDLAAIKLQSKIIFVWGKAVYMDAFGQNWVFTFRGRSSEHMMSYKPPDGEGWVGWGVSPHPGFGDEETKG